MAVVYRVCFQETYQKLPAKEEGRLRVSKTDDNIHTFWRSFILLWK